MVLDRVQIVGIAAVAALALVLASPAAAQLNDPRQQAQCELSAIANTRSTVAIQTIRSACNWLALNSSSFLNESNKPYYLCLVQYLSGVQDDSAAAGVMSACRRAYLD